jgi:putative phosphoesterase
MKARDRRLKFCKPKIGPATKRLQRKSRTLIGVISDTHGLIRPEALSVLAGADLIIHAGDIGEPRIIDALAAIANVVAIRGNNDRGAWAKKLPETAIVEVGVVKILVTHDGNDLAADPGTAGYRVVISGHSHNPSAIERGGVLFLNPGSAGPRRFNLPVSVARLRVEGAAVRAAIVKLEVPTGKT